jgi:non-ribosomal peptide synthetase component F
VIGDDYRLIVLESVSAGVGTDNLLLSISSLDTGYITYTSGSTGQPKGVQENHADQLQKVRRATNSEGIHHGDRIDLFSNGTANTVDIIFLALLNGAVLLPFDVKKQGVSHLVD